MFVVKFRPFSRPLKADSRIQQRGYISRFLASKLLQPRNVVPLEGGGEKRATKKATEISAKSHRLLVDTGFIKPAHPGSFTLLPLAIRCVEKLTSLIDSHMRDIGGQKILLPTLTESVLWDKSGRLNSMGGELLRLQDRHKTEFVFSPTHEEAVTSLVSKLHPLTSKNLPLLLYQISVKFRDELKPKFGLIRSKEFLMKDLYSFDKDLQSAEETYQKVFESYNDIFRSLNMAEKTVSVKGEPGEIGGQKSHEFHFLADIGQDNLLVCPQCRQGYNKEMIESDRKECEKCRIPMETSKGIEVGHTFLLGDKYSKPFNANYTNGSANILQMGCFGLGVSRILAACVEVLSTETELRFPAQIVPFTACVLAPKRGSHEEKKVMPQVWGLYDRLNSSVFAQDVLLDDREKATVGKKLREAQKSGHRFIVLFGKDSVNPTRPLVEVHTTDSGQILKLPPDHVPDKLKEMSQISQL